MTDDERMTEAMDKAAECLRFAMDETDLAKSKEYRELSEGWRMIGRLVAEKVGAIS